MFRNLLVMMLAIMLAFVLFGCEGEEGPQGPAGPQGEVGEDGEDGEDGKDATTDPYTFIGNNGDECAHCHGATVDGWMGTAHPNAYADLEAEDQENPYCLQCHVTGVDEMVAFGATEFPGGEDMYGYDNYFGVEGDSAAMRRAALEGVQCEACHGALGPLDGVGAHRAEVGLSTIWEDVGGEIEFESTCMPCHERQLEEWQMSGHANAGGNLEGFREEHYAGGSCAPCHTGEGFIAANDPAHADYDGPYSWVGCQTCHDPHNANNPGQLRNVDPVYVEFHPGYDPEEDGEMGTMDGYFAGQTCAQCHHARRDTDNVLNQIAEGYGHFGPHSSPQMDMFIGYGCYEIDGYEYERENSHQNVLSNEEENGCVACHMVRFEELHGEEAEHVYHQFAPEGAACYGCHSLDPGDFDKGGVQTDTEAKMNELAAALGYTDYMDFEANFDSQADGVTVPEREAAYALVFVISDGSHGIHNPSYSMDLLQNAIDHLAE
ncbi:ammonia-forming cytochrome c nitrite reductase subunit c552 [bacterium]|nr:ammonia-forming cytochrome c nitrite reductase subunit c552 [bacterium]